MKLTFALSRFGQWIRRWLYRFQAKSLGLHASIVVRDLTRAIEFYERLGFRRVAASRQDEIMLLRNASGAELNLVHRPGAKPEDIALKTGAAIAVASLDETVAAIHKSGVTMETGPVAGPNSRWLVVRDPDRNTIEFYQTLANADNAEKALFHIVTRDELGSGISEFYYSPPEDERRFVYCTFGSAIMQVAAVNVRRRVEHDLYLVRFDAGKVSLAPAMDFESDIDRPRPADDFPTYPDVYRPISMDAIVGASPLEPEGDSFHWPDRFVPLDAVLA